METDCRRQLLQAGASTRTDSTTHISLLDPRLNPSSHLKLNLAEVSTSKCTSKITTGSNQNHSTDHDQNVQQPDGRSSVQCARTLVCSSHVLVCARRRLDCASSNAPKPPTRAHTAPSTGQQLLFASLVGPCTSSSLASSTTIISMRGLQSS